MSVFDSPGSELQWLEDELMDEEDFAEAFSEPESMADRKAIFVEKRPTGAGKFKFLAALELLAILAVIWWWIKWLY